MHDLLRRCRCPWQRSHARSPSRKDPDVGIERVEAGLVAEVGADEFLEVSAFFALRHRGGTVFGEDCFKWCHSIDVERELD